MATGQRFAQLPVSSDGTNLAVFGNISTGQSSVATPGNSATITTSGIGSARVNPSGNVTGIILQAGTRPAQEVRVVNESAFTLTMAASGTSNVADGTSDVISATSTHTYYWDSGTSLWYAAGGGSSGSFADPTTTKGDLIVHGSSTTRLAVGSNTQVFTADAAQTLGVKWAAPAAGASTSDHYVVGFSGQNDSDLSNKIVIPSLSAHPDIRVAGTNDDEFDQNAAGVPSGWTIFGPDSPAADTNTYLSHVHVSAVSNAGISYNGIYKAAPSIPYTVTCKLADLDAHIGNAECALLIMDGTTTGKMVASVCVYTSSHLVNEWETFTNWTTAITSGNNVDNNFIVPYVRMTVHAANNIDVAYSRNGYSWMTITTGVSTLSNATYVALGINPHNQTTNAYWDWVRFT